MNLNSETITIHGQDVAVTTGGSGPAIVLVHGLAGSARTWDPVVEQLAQSFRVIAPDLPGHGDSAKPRGDYSLGAFATFLRDLMDHFDCAAATIVGQSLGGGISMQFSYQYPERCERLVLVSTGGLGEEVSPILRVLTVPGVELLLPIAYHPYVRTVRDRVGAFLSRLGVKPSPQMVEMLRSVDSLADPQTRSAFIHTSRSVIDPRGQRVNAKDRLHVASALPTLIVWGDADSIIPVTHGTEAHELIKHSRLEIFEGVGHFPHREQPTRFASLLHEFIEGTGSGHRLPSSAVTAEDGAR